jgi:hypothetical protein
MDMNGGLWALAASAALAGLGCFYQKAWDRRERRLEHYFGIIDRLPAFLAAAPSSHEMNATITEIRRLWIVGPNDVVRAANAFLEIIDGVRPQEEKEKALRAFILAMRRDSTFASALAPRFFRNKLSSDEILLRTATPR